MITNKTIREVVIADKLFPGGSGESTYDTRTASGAIATFNTNVVKPLRSLTAQIVPIQEGTGDPSPSNPRPISGTSVLDIYHSGEDTSNPTIYTIALGQTVYGGTYNSKTGVLSVTWGVQSLGSMSFTKESTCQHTFRRQGLLRKYGVGNYNLISSVFKTYTSGHSTGSNISTLETGNDFTIFVNSGSNTFYISADSSYDDKTAEDFRQDFQNVDLYYELATPLEIQLEPTEIATLLGVNNIWHDGNGDSEVSYLYQTGEGGSKVNKWLPIFYPIRKGDT